MRIPKTIVQTSKEKLPEYVVEMIKEKAPNWEYKHFTDKEILQYFINNPIPEFPLIINKFWNLKGGEHKADLFRYYFLYNEGGVYIDSDAMIEANLDEITKEYQFFSVNSYLNGTIFQGFIGCTPNNAIMYKALKDIYDINNDDLMRNYYLITANLFKIIYTNFYDFEYKLYYEQESDDEKAKTVNDEGVVILTHYWKDKAIPQTIDLST